MNREIPPVWQVWVLLIAVVGLIAVAAWLDWRLGLHVFAAVLGAWRLGAIGARIIDGPVRAERDEARQAAIGYARVGIEEGIFELEECEDILKWEGKSDDTFAWEVDP